MEGSKTPVLKNNGSIYNDVRSEAFVDGTSVGKGSDPTANPAVRYETDSSPKTSSLHHARLPRSTRRSIDQRYRAILQCDAIL